MNLTPIFKLLCLLPVGSTSFHHPLSYISRIAREVDLNSSNDNNDHIFRNRRMAQSTSHNTALSAEQYGKGAEIWPPGNDEHVTLAGSFPNGIIPTPIVEALQQDQTNNDDDNNIGDTPKRGKRIRKGVWNILRNAARVQRNASVNDPSTTMPVEQRPSDTSNLLPVGLAIGFAAAGLIPPGDILFTVAFSGYLLVLYRWCQGEEGGDSLKGRTRMPSLPPQGHVPNLVANPLGYTLTQSTTYKYWLRAGAIIGLLAPLIASGFYYGVTKNVAVAAACARPVFLICCQATCEAVSRRVMAPLPLRILVPIVYNAKRLGPIWDWVTLPTPLGYAGRLLAMANLLYWSINLFGFLLPIASMRYLRAHFSCVEASEVTVREGHEDVIGLVP